MPTNIEHGSFINFYFCSQFQLEKENRKLDESQSTEKQYNEQIHRLHNDIRKLENQLDVVNKRCGNLMFDNANLRSSIDHLLMER